MASAQTSISNDISSVLSSAGDKLNTTSISNDLLGMISPNPILSDGELSSVSGGTLKDTSSHSKGLRSSSEDGHRLMSAASSSSSSTSSENVTTDNKKLLLDINQELVQFISRVIPSVEDMTSHNNVVLDLVRDVARRVLDPSADIQMFGSAASGLCERGSDIDATIVVDFQILNRKFHGKNRMPSIGHETRQLCSEAVCLIAKYIEEHPTGTGVAVEGLIHGAKVPIVVLSSFGRQIIDVSINNVLPTFNTKLLAEYAKLDSRVIGLIVCVKRWAKMAQVSDAKMGNLSSYSWSLLCIYYLQQLGVIPSLQTRAPPGLELHQCLTTGKTFDVGFLSGMSAVTEKKLFCKGSNMCLAETLCGFFEFYDRDYKWGQEVVSIRLGTERRSVTDPECSHLSQGPRLTSINGSLPPRIHIEDPFDLTRNLHCVMDTEGLVRLRKAFSDIASKLQGANVNVLTHLSKTLMTYKNAAPTFATAELHKRYGAGLNPNTVVSNMSWNQKTIDEDKAAEAILRNYSKQQEILKTHLYNMQQRNTVVRTTPQVSGPGRGSYKQRNIDENVWHTVDLW